MTMNSDVEKDNAENKTFLHSSRRGVYPQTKKFFIRFLSSISAATGKIVQFSQKKPTKSGGERVETSPVPNE
jgi:hypothetical protein